jgi:hypothetical protein
MLVAFLLNQVFVEHNHPNRQASIISKVFTVELHFSLNKNAIVHFTCSRSLRSAFLMAQKGGEPNLQVRFSTLLIDAIAYAHKASH